MSRVSLGTFRSPPTTSALVPFDKLASFASSAPLLSSPFSPVCFTLFLLLVSDEDGGIEISGCENPYSHPLVSSPLHHGPFPPPGTTATVCQSRPVRRSYSSPHRRRGLVSSPPLHPPRLPCHSLHRSPSQGRTCWCQGTLYPHCHHRDSLGYQRPCCDPSLPQQTSCPPHPLYSQARDRCATPQGLLRHYQGPPSPLLSPSRSSSPTTGTYTPPSSPSTADLPRPYVPVPSIFPSCPTPPSSPDEYMTPDSPTPLPFVPLPPSSSPSPAPHATAQVEESAAEPDSPPNEVMDLISEDEDYLDDDDHDEEMKQPTSSSPHVPSSISITNAYSTLGRFPKTPPVILSTSTKRPRSPPSTAPPPTSSKKSKEGKNSRRAASAPPSRRPPSPPPLRPPPPLPPPPSRSQPPLLPPTPLVPLGQRRR